MNPPRLIPGLDEEQSAAAGASHEPGSRCDVIAGAGAGKTRVLIRRALALASSYASAAPRATMFDSPVALITFTVAAAEEIAARLPASVRVWTGTIHAFAAAVLDRTLRYRGRRLLDPDDCALLRRHAMDVAGRTRGEAVFRAWLAEAHATDYDGILNALVEVLRSGSLPTGELPLAVLVDEAQDLDETQHALVRQLERCGVHVTLAGDPRQSIYRFRGACPSKWEQVAPMVVCANYRSRASIVAFANSLPIAASWPPMRAVRAGGRDVSTADLDSTLAHEPSAILCRSWRDVGRVAARCRELGVEAAVASSDTTRPSQVVHGVACWLRWCAAPHDRNLAWLAATQLGVSAGRQEAVRMWPAPASGWDTSTLATDAVEELVRWLGPERGAPVAAAAARIVRPGQTIDRFVRWWQFGRAVALPEPRPGGPVVVTTIHAAKGLEWNIVAVVGARWQSLDLEEQSICYVAATRARDELVIVEDTDGR